MAIISKKIWGKVCQIYNWFDEKGYNNNYDLSVADEFFVLYAVITLYVSNTPWLQNAYRPIIQTIVLIVSMNVVMIIISLNQKKFWLRIIFYILTVIFSLIGTEIILEISGHDLVVQRKELSSITFGILVWMGIREIATFTMNLLPKNKNKD